MAMKGTSMSDQALLGEIFQKRTTCFYVNIEAFSWVYSKEGCEGTFHGVRGSQGR